MDFLRLESPRVQAVAEDVGGQAARALGERRSQHRGQAWPHAVRSERGLIGGERAEEPQGLGDPDPPGTAAPRRSPSSAWAASGAKLRTAPARRAARVRSREPRSRAPASRGRRRGRRGRASRRQSQGDAATGRPTCDSDPLDAEAFEHNREIVRRGRDRGPLTAATGSEPPYPGRSAESSLTFLARVSAGSGSKMPRARGAVASTRGAPRRLVSSPWAGNQAVFVVVLWTATRRPDSRNRIARRDANAHSRHLLSSFWNRLTNVRASRLVSFLLVLQTRGQLTAEEARRAARGLRANGAARRPGTCGGRSADRLGPRTGRRLSARARLPDKADGARRHRGRSALRRPGRGARARPRAGRGRPEAACPCPQSCRSRPESGAALPSTRAAGFARRTGPAPARDRRCALARSPPRHPLPRRRAASCRAASDRSASSSRRVSGYLLAQRRGEGPGLPCFARRLRQGTPERQPRPPEYDLAAAWTGHSEAFERSPRAGRRHGPRVPRPVSATSDPPVVDATASGFGGDPRSSAASATPFVACSRTARRRRCLTPHELQQQIAAAAAETAALYARLLDGEMRNTTQAVAQVRTELVIV